MRQRSKARSFAGEQVKGHRRREDVLYTPIVVDRLCERRR